jgi:hypothetical protein
MVAAAVIGGAVIGAAGSAYAGSKSASATTNASNNAITEQNNALQQQATLSQPYRDLGTSNIQTYQNLLTGANGPAGANAAPGSATAGANIEQTLQTMPGYQATLTQGTEAAQRAAGASGLNLSGNQVAGVQQFGSQLADSTYQTQLANLLQPIQLGQAAAAGQAANVGTAATNVGNIGINQGNNIANIDANEIAGITRAGSGAANQLITYNTLQGLQSPAGGGAAAVPTYGGTPNFDGSANYGTPAPATTPGYS